MIQAAVPAAVVHIHMVELAIPGHQRFLVALAGGLRQVLVGTYHGLHAGPWAQQGPPCSVSCQVTATGCCMLLKLGIWSWAKLLSSCDSMIHLSAFKVVESVRPCAGCSLRIRWSHLDPTRISQNRGTPSNPPNFRDVSNPPNFNKNFQIILIFTGFSLKPSIFSWGYTGLPPLMETFPTPRAPPVAAVAWIDAEVQPQHRLGQV